jgi:hypothetical protein
MKSCEKKRNETCNTLIVNGKYFLPPSEFSGNFKEIFRDIVSRGVGRPVDMQGFPSGPWTPETLAEAISQIEINRETIDLRTVQLWFQENDRGISAKNIRWLGRIFGCDNPKYTKVWQDALTASHLEFKAERKLKRLNIEISKLKEDGSSERMLDEDFASKSIALPKNSKKKRNLSNFVDEVFSARSPLDLPIFVWGGFVTLGFISFIFDVHSVTYNPVVGVDKQVGFLWAPNWTLLEVVILPLFLILVSNALIFWKAKRQSLNIPNTREWSLEVSSFLIPYWVVTIVCFALVFAAQWSGIHLRSLLNNEHSNLMIDWTVIGIVRPDVISKFEGVVLSMLAFLYTSFITWLFLCGLIVLLTISFDIKNLHNELKSNEFNFELRDISSSVSSIQEISFRCAVLGSWISICVRLQAAYLMNDSENILIWMRSDALSLFGFGQDETSTFNHRPMAHFTSFLLMFDSIFSFLVCTYNFNPTRKLSHLPKRMLLVISLLVVNFTLIGKFNGFSVILMVSLLISLFSLVNSSARQYEAQAK